jgi:hypothetical protein
LIDVTELHRLADLEAAAIGLFLIGDHTEERRLAGAVGTDDADDAARRQTEREIVDQQPVAIRFGNTFGLNDEIAEARAWRQHDLHVLGRFLFALRQQIFIGREARLALRLTCARALLDPVELAFERALPRFFLLALLREALLLLVEPAGVVSLIGNAATAIELEDPSRDIIKEIAISQATDSASR